MIKKILLLTFCATLQSLTGSANDDFSYTYEGQTVNYTITDKNAMTCRTKSFTDDTPGNKVIGSLIIPEVVSDGKKEYTVTSIGYGSFYSNEGLTSVTVPNSVKTIDGFAFSRCKGLTSVTLPNSISNIEECAFADCRELTSVSIPDSVNNIGENAFINCIHLESVVLPNSVREIGKQAFGGCLDLSAVTISNPDIKIGENAFTKCGKITNWSLPEALLEKPIQLGNLRYRLEYDATKGTGTAEVLRGEDRYSGNITIPSFLTINGKKYNVTKIESYAFDSNGELSTITIEPVLESIGGSTWLFSNCLELTKIIFPDEKTAMANEKFLKDMVGRNTRIKFYVGEQPYAPKSPELNRVEAKMPYSITKDHGQLYWAKSATGASQLVTNTGKVILTDKYDKIYFELEAIIVKKNGKYGAISYTGKVLASPIYQEYEGGGIEDRLAFSNKTQTGVKVFIISQKGVVIASRAFTNNQFYSLTNWMSGYLKFVHKPEWSFPAK